MQEKSQNFLKNKKCRIKQKETYEGTIQIKYAKKKIRNNLNIKGDNMSGIKKTYAEKKKRKKQREKQIEIQIVKQLKKLHKKINWEISS